MCTFVKRHAIVDVLCRPVVNVVIGVHIFVLPVPLVVVHFVVLILIVVILYQFIPLFHRSHFSHMFSLYSHGIFGVVFTPDEELQAFGPLSVYLFCFSCVFQSFVLSLFFLFFV